MRKPAMNSGPWLCIRKSELDLAGYAISCVKDRYRSATPASSTSPSWATILTAASAASPRFTRLASSFTYLNRALAALRVDEGAGVGVCAP